MIIRSRATLNFSLSTLVVSIVQLIFAYQVYVTTATRDFNFGPPALIMLAILQIIVSLVGVSQSLNRK